MRTRMKTDRVVQFVSGHMTAGRKLMLFGCVKLHPITQRNALKIKRYAVKRYNIILL